MRATIRTWSSTGFVALGLASLLLQLISIQQAVGSKVDNKVLSRWKPLAMDEALMVKKDLAGRPTIRDNLVKGDFAIKENYSLKPSSPFGVSDDAEISHRIPEPIEETPLFSSDRTFRRKSANEMDDDLGIYERRISVEKGDFIPLPERPTSSLTRLIANGGRDVPTFTMNDAIEPNPAMIGTKTKEGQEILASYNLIIPIFVPGVRSKAFLTTIKPEPVKFVKETVTEMVPMTKTVPVVKEVIKAEKVPQELVTDYVTTRSRTVPPRITDAVLPGERIVTSTVTLLD